MVARWQQILLALKERLRAIPSKARKRIRKLTRKEERVLLALVDEALSELATDGVPRA